MSFFQKLKRIYTSLSLRIILILLVVMAVFGNLFIAGISSAIQGVSNTRDGVTESRIISERISNQIFRIENTLRIAALAVQGSELTSFQQRGLVDSLKVKSNLNSAYILPGEKLPVELDDCGKLIREGKFLVWSQAYLKSIQGEKPNPTVTCMVPLINFQKKVYAILCSDYQFTSSQAKDGVSDLTFYYNIEDSNGLYLCHWDSTLVMTHATKDMKESDMHGSLSMNSKIENMGWTINGRVKFDEESRITQILKLIVYIVTGVLFLILSLAIIFIVRWHIRPLQKITDAANAVSNGDFSAELPKVWANTEIKHLRNSFRRMQVKLVDYINDLKTSTEKNASMERDLAIASEIQQGLLPKVFPDREDVDIYGMQKPARIVGGDLYDFFIFEDHLFFCIGDVSGKGVPAALFMTVVCHLFRHIGRHTKDPALITKSINLELAEGNKKSMFCTLFLGVLDLKTLKLEFCNAGHNYPVWLQKDKTDYLVAEVDIPTGAFSEAEYRIQEIQLNPGDALFLYTDGVTEAQNLQQDYWGEASLLETLKDAPSGSPMKELTDSVLRSVATFTEGAVQNDDITILCLRV